MFIMMQHYIIKVNEKVDGTIIEIKILMYQNAIKENKKEKNKNNVNNILFYLYFSRIYITIYYQTIIQYWS